MAKQIKQAVHVSNPPKKSASSGNPAMVKMSSMNKNKKRAYKKYRGQGR